jgi:DNA helicase-2/ATP-dependent DNA helicase PcrA
MPSPNRAIICAAGGGKTTGIVREAFADKHARSALVTYTRNNEREIQSKFFALSAAIPPHVEIMTWYVFLLQELARPYRNFMHDQRIDGLCWVEGRSALGIAATKISTHYFADKRKIYSDKISKFICECNKMSDGAIMKRLSNRFDHIFIDEVQDLAGYDLEVVELMLKAGIKVTLVGDHRQSILTTNNNNMNNAFKGIKIVKKFRLWEKAKLLTTSYDTKSHRCHQHIASLADSLFPNEQPTTSLNSEVTGHDGVFVVPTSKLAEYLRLFRPQILRYDRRTQCSNFSQPMNFGEAKGLTFDRVLIYPHGPCDQWLRSGDPNKMGASNTKMYVGITRARFSVAFVFDGNAKIPHAQLLT